MLKEVTVGVSNKPIWIVRFDTEKQIRKVIWTKSEKSRDMIIPPKYQTYVGFNNFFNLIADDERPLIDYLDSIQEHGFFTGVQANLTISVDNIDVF